MSAPSLFLLEPPYASARRMHDVDPFPSLGTIALFDATERRPSSNEVKGEMARAPWCPLCLLASPDSGMRTVRRLPRTCVVFAMDEGDGGEAILRAVAARPRPTPSDLVEWVLRRTRLPALGRVLSDLFSRPPLRRADASLLGFHGREPLRQLGEWGPAEWQAAATLAELAADRTLLNRILASENDSAAEMRRLMQERLGVTEREFHQRYGWEWVLEASLRNSGFFERRQPALQFLRPLNAFGPPMYGSGEVSRRATA